MNRLSQAGLFALAAVLATRVWEISFFGIEAIRVGFGSLFIMLAGMYLGPLYGACIGSVADITGFLLQRSTGMPDYVPQITLVNALWGALPWYVFKWRKFSTHPMDLLLALGLPQIMLSIGAMSYIVHSRFGTPLEDLLRTRTIAQSVTLPIYVSIAYVIFRNREYGAAVQKSEEKYRSLVTEMQQGLALHEIVCDGSGHAVDYTFLDVNESYERLTGLNRDEIIGESVLRVWPKTEPYWIEAFGKVALSGEPRKLEYYAEELDRYYSVTAYSPAPRQFAVIVDDVTDKRRAEDQLRASEEKFRQIAETIGEVFWLCSADNTEVLYINPAYETVWGRTCDSLYEDPASLAESVYDQDKPSVSVALERYAKTGNFNLEYRIVQPSGQTRWVHVRWFPVKDGDTVIRHTGSAVDITERRQAEKEVEYLSFHEGLTGLYNRRFFDEALKRLDVPRNLPLTLMMLDVNGLKLTNDAFGHPAGDELLTKVAAVLQDVCRPHDIIARVGGDEFGILLPQLGEEQAHQMTKRIQQAAASENVEGLPISVSCGWGTKTDPHEGMTDVLKTAEDYMYRHKISERNSHRHQSIDLIMQTLYAKSPREQQHSKRVSQLCTALGKAMGLDAQELTTAGMLHDIGKVAISEGILDKVHPLTETEWVEMQKHPEAGYSILSAVNDLGLLADCVLAHHERWDGGGYPNGLKGDSIPLLARVIAVVDAYDAMVSDRSYRKGMSHDDAMEEIDVCAGFQFDPEIVQVFVEMMREHG